MYGFLALYNKSLKQQIVQINSRINVGWNKLFSGQMFVNQGSDSIRTQTLEESNEQCQLQTKKRVK